MAMLRASEKAGREATEARAGTRARANDKARPAGRGSLRAEAATSARNGARDWLVARARQRIESGFYEDPLILEAAVARIIASERQSSREGSNSAGV